MSSEPLRGRVALVTGASAGLGWQFALTLASAGAAVAVAARRTDRLRVLVADIIEAGGRALALPMDVADPDDVVRCVDIAQAELGLVDILVNNAGIPDARLAHMMDVQLVDQVLATNVRGPYLLSIEVARRLIDAGFPGRIVNISSMGAFHYAGRGSTLYSIAKAAVNGMTEVLAVEWARNHINVNAIAPGAFSTEMMDGMIARVGDFTEGSPRGRIGTPAQLDATLLYLVGPGSELVTGTIVKVDDGQLPR